MLGAARIHLGIGWGRKSEQPDVLGGVYVRTGTGFSHRRVAIGDHPFILTMLDLEPPGVLRGTDSSVGYTKVRAWFYNLQGDTQARAGKFGEGRVRLEQITYIPEFPRMLAKIGHSFACAVLGADSFDPALLDIISGKSTGFAYLIGGADEYLKTMNDSRELLHNVWLNSALHPNNLNDRPLIVCAVQLFSCLESPIYQVVVGRSFIAGPQLIK